MLPASPSAAKTRFRLLLRWPCSKLLLKKGRASGGGGALARRRSYEGAEPRDRLADDQGLHLVGAFVGVDCLGIREVARHIVVDQDAVAAHQLAGPRDRFARFGRAERLDDRRLRIGQLALGL